MSRGSWPPRRGRRRVTATPRRVPAARKTPQEQPALPGTTPGTPRSPQRASRSRPEPSPPAAGRDAERIAGMLALRNKIIAESGTLGWERYQVNRRAALITRWRNERKQRQTTATNNPFTQHTPQ